LNFNDDLCKKIRKDIIKHKANLSDAMSKL